MIIATERKMIEYDADHPQSCPTGIQSLCNQRLRNDQAVLRQLLADYKNMKCKP